MNGPAGRRLWAGLELLDHQILDHDGQLAGKVDDLEFEIGDDGRPVLTALLSGLGALAGQLGGDAGKVLAEVERRVAERTSDPGGRIPVELVSGIDDHVTVSAFARRPRQRSCRAMGARRGDRADPGSRSCG